jgi:hypothetical protein
MESENNQENITYKEKLNYVIKDLYTLKNYIFIPLSLYCLYLFLFKIDEVSIGSIISRLLQFIIVFFLGGLLGMKIGESTLAEGVYNIKYSAKSFRVGVVSLLFFFTFGQWLDREGEKNDRITRSRETCLECGKLISGDGWSTIDGEQFQNSNSGYNFYCSKQCAYNSQPNRWK